MKALFAVDREETKVSSGWEYIYEKLSNYLAHAGKFLIPFFRPEIRCFVLPGDKAEIENASATRKCFNNTSTFNASWGLLKVSFINHREKSKKQTFETQLFQFCSMKLLQTLKFFCFN